MADSKKTDSPKEIVPLISNIKDTRESADRESGEVAPVGDVETRLLCETKYTQNTVGTNKTSHSKHNKVNNKGGCFQGLGCFVAGAYFFNFNIAWLVSVMVSVITSVGIRYGFNSIQVGFLASVGMMGTVLALPFVTYFCGKRFDHRPRWIAFGGILMAIGLSIMLLPQFLTDKYSRGLKTNETIADTEGATFITSRCLADETDLTDLLDSCDNVVLPEVLWKGTRDSHLAFLCFLVGKFISGIGYAPVSTLMTSYIDDFGGDNAPLYIGLVWLLLIVPATIITGYIMKKLRLSLVGISKVVILLTLLAAVSSGLLFLFQCEGVSYHSQNHGIVQQNEDLKSTCNEHCDCSTDHFQPVCGQDGNNYFSPCYAGCSDLGTDTEVKNYEDCSCVFDPMDNSSMSRDSTAVEGLCPNDSCHWRDLLLFFVCIVIFAMATHGGMVPNMVITMRSVEEKYKSFALGIRNIFIYLFSYVPGVLVSQHIVEFTCAVWETKCGEQTSCVSMNNELFRRSFIVLTTSTTVISLVLYFIMYILIRTKMKPKLITEFYNRESKKAERIALHPKAKSSKKIKKPSRV
ncbi:solute carrier organic anion transporter family member 3A1-like [Glandiceps talaboti]